MSGTRFARCTKCNKLTDSFGQYLVPAGRRWEARCHGTNYTIEQRHADMFKPDSDKKLEDAFAKHGITFYVRQNL
ncbi:MAG: hypothetical protein ACRCV5_02655 [Afipia sp.]